MTTRQRKRVASLLGTLVLALALTTVATAAKLTRVESRHVCMVNNTAFPRDQIPVEVEGRTYYGCCEMCKGRLASDAAVRSAKDPVSGATVDKSSAVIASGPDGKVLYFENEASLERYESDR